MKKIFRMALVLALGGATLLYTGCTKDYDEDINSLESKFSSLQSELNSKVSSLEGQVASLQSSLSSIESAYKAADAALQSQITANAGDITTLKTNVSNLQSSMSTLEGKVSSLESELATIKADLANYATKDELDAAKTALETKITEAQAALETKIGEVKTEILEKVGALEESVNAVKEQVEANTAAIGENAEAIEALQEALDAIQEVYAAIGDGLRAIVFIPDFYYAGIEATSYDFLNVVAYAGVPATAAIETSDDEQGPAVIAKGELATFVEYVDAKKAHSKDYTLGQIGVANYDLNPSTFDAATATWKLNGMDRTYVPQKGLESEEEEDATKVEVKTWLPVFEAINVVAGEAAVNYHIENPELLLYGENVPVMQLEATLEDGKLISSDWEAVVSSTEGKAHLAFEKTNSYITKNAEDCGLVPNAIKDLYLTAEDAVKNEASVPAKYNGGPIDLAKLVAIHLTDEEDNVKQYTLAELVAKYPGFSLNFQQIAYTIGENVTGENYYGSIDGTEFTPCYVESVAGKPQSVVIEKDAEVGISSVGRKPVVLATLVDEAGTVAAYGYFKIIITKDIVEPTTREFVIPGLPSVPFICNPYTLATTWHEFSYFVLETLGVDYAEFIANYEFKGVYADEVTATKPAIKIERIEVADKYGEATYTKDRTGSGINDAFEWKVDPQAIGEGKSQTIFFRFESGAYDIVYFAMTANVAGAAKFDFGANKISNEWYDDIDNDPKNTVRINVLVPNATDDDVTEFYRDLNRFFIGYQPAVSLTSDADPVYAELLKDKDLKSELETNSTYTFSEKQPAIDGIQLFTNSWGYSDKLYAAIYDNAGKIVTDEYTDLDGNKVTGPKIDEANLIAYLAAAAEDSSDAESTDETEEGTNDEAADDSEATEEETEEAAATVLYYSYAEGETIAKELLNLWSYTETDQAKMLYANITVKTTYGKCEIPAGTEGFHVRFVRPLDINFKNADVAQESAVTGFNVLIAQFLGGITDWNKQRVIVPEVVNKQETGYYVANVINGVNMYTYYGFSKLTLDLEKAKRDHFKIGDDDATDLLTNVTPEAQLSLGTVDATTGVFTASEDNFIDISDIANLKGAAVNYKNDRAVVETFNLFIPVAIEYAWGTINDTLTIRVKPTSETDPK